jgi:hypothetical protein
MIMMIMMMTKKKERKTTKDIDEGLKRLARNKPARANT